MRRDYSAAELRRLARNSKDVRQSSRLLSLAAVADGMNRTDAARIGGMDRQTLRDWVHRFNEAGPDGLPGTAARCRGFRPSNWPSSPRLSKPVPILPSTA
jgi:transposase-like protein